MEAVHKQAGTDAREKGGAFKAPRCGEARGEFEQAKAKAVAARQDARGPSDKLAYKHSKANRFAMV